MGWWDEGSSGAVTLERGKLDLSHKPSSKISPETAIGGGGGDIGKRNSYGGGDGGDDGGDDDDDYFGDFDESDEGDEGGLFRRHILLQEFFDGKFVGAVLQEWYKTMKDLPAGLCHAFEMVMPLLTVSKLKIVVREVNMTWIIGPTSRRFLAITDGAIFSNLCKANFNQILFPGPSTISIRGFYWKIKMVSAKTGRFHAKLVVSPGIELSEGAYSWWWQSIWERGNQIKKKCRGN